MRFSQRFCFFPLLSLLILFASCGVAANVNRIIPAHLLCENRVDPLGVDNLRPRLDWQIHQTDGAVRGVKQTAYQILAASSADFLDQNKSDLWDSGRVNSSETHQIAYAGKSLASSQKIFWKMRVWDQNKQASQWSESAQWVMGIIGPDDWKNAHWITLGKGDNPSALLRYEFSAKQSLVRATVHASGLGQYELQLNGAKVGQDILTPGWTDYRKTVLYDTYDVTAQIRAGANAIGIVLGNGMYTVEKSAERYNKFKGNQGEQKAIALLRLDYADGTTDWIATNSDWQAHISPITYSNVYGGEDVDARLLQAGWDQPGFAKQWDPAAEVAAPSGKLTGLSAAGIPIRVIETFKPVNEKIIRPGVIVFDLGQNVSLIPRISVKGAAGARLRITPSELVKPTGDIDDTMTKGKGYWDYTLAGNENEHWFPQFFYRGARYLRVELFPANAGDELPQLLSIQGDVVHAAVQSTGQFNSSNELFNRTFTLVRWAQRSNLMSVLTDCPQREKLGWIEQTYLNGPALRYNFALNSLFSKTVGDIHDAQQANGLVPDIAPEYVVFSGGFRESAEWGSAFIQVPWQQYLFTGDLEPARLHYAGMKKYIDYLEKLVDEKGLLHISNALGDWYDIGTKPPGRAQLTPPDLTASAIYYDDLLIMSRFAHQLKHEEDQRHFQQLAEKLKNNFTRAYYNATTANYASGSQTANAMPFFFGMVDKKNTHGVVENIVKDVKVRSLTAGDVGYRYLLRALADGGRSDVVFDMNNQSDKPGYGYQLKKGATSLTEAWDARPDSSQNHFMLGQINEWFFHDLAGIQPDPEAPGFRHIIIRPAIVGDLTFVEARYESVNGSIRSKWTRDGHHLTLEITIPPNSTAQVFLPTKNANAISERGKNISHANGVKLRGIEAGVASLQILSGHYSFKTTLPIAQSR